jgi:cbb3-type cytochrome oxidase subunit 3
MILMIVFFAVLIGVIAFLIVAGKKKSKGEKLGERENI